MKTKIRLEPNLLLSLYELARAEGVPLKTLIAILLNEALDRRLIEKRYPAVVARREQASEQADHQSSSRIYGKSEADVRKLG